MEAPLIKLGKDRNYKLITVLVAITFGWVSCKNGDWEAGVAWRAGTRGCEVLKILC